MDQKVSSLTPQGSDSVRVVLRDELNTDKFLILSEADDPDNMKLPGGKFEAGEDEFAAAIRELAEELNLSVSKAELGDVVELINDDGVSRRFIFDIQVSPSDVKPSAEIAELLWVDEDSIPSGKNHGHILSALKSKNIKTNQGTS
jgi:8-oxo-dGTP pyrophosphatase MutT (NUDIX family)